MLGQWLWKVDRVDSFTTSNVEVVMVLLLSHVEGE
jgi:hypothetical protein